MACACILSRPDASEACGRELPDRKVAAILGPLLRRHLAGQLAVEIRFLGSHQAVVRIGAADQSELVRIDADRLFARHPVHERRTREGCNRCFRRRTGQQLVADFKAGELIIGRQRGIGSDVPLVWKISITRSQCMRSRAYSAVWGDHRCPRGRTSSHWTCSSCAGSPGIARQWRDLRHAQPGPEVFGARTVVGTEGGSGWRLPHPRRSARHGAGSGNRAWLTIPSR